MGCILAGSSGAVLHLQIESTVSPLWHCPLTKILTPVSSRVSQASGEIASFDKLVVVGVPAVMLFLAWTGFRVARWEGLAILAGYAAYVILIWP